MTSTSMVHDWDESRSKATKIKHKKAMARSVQLTASISTAETARDASRTEVRLLYS